MHHDKFAPVSSVKGVRQFDSSASADSLTKACSQFLAQTMQTGTAVLNPNHQTEQNHFCVSRSPSLACWQWWWRLYSWWGYWLKPSLAPWKCVSLHLGVLLLDHHGIIKDAPGSEISFGNSLICITGVSTMVLRCAEQWERRMKSPTTCFSFTVIKMSSHLETVQRVRPKTASL